MVRLVCWEITFCVRVKDYQEFEADQKGSDSIFLPARDRGDVLGLFLHPLQMRGIYARLAKHAAQHPSPFRVYSTAVHSRHVFDHHPHHVV